MKWIEIIIPSLIPLVGVVLGWVLSERAKIWADKKQDKRKLKKLLFYALELRFYFSRELRAQKDIDEFFSKIEQKVKDEFGESIATEAEIAKPIIGQIIKKHLKVNNRMNFLEKNIDAVINDLAEVFPIFAYELSGQHNIKQRLKAIDNYLIEVDRYTDEIPFDLKEWIRPKVTDDLLKYLDENLKKISHKIGNGTWKNVASKIKNMDKQDDSDLDSLLNEYIEKIKDSNP